MRKSNFKLMYLIKPHHLHLATFGYLWWRAVTSYLTAPPRQQNYFLSLSGILVICHFDWNVCLKDLSSNLTGSQETHHHNTLQLSPTTKPFGSSHYFTYMNENIRIYTPSLTECTNSSTPLNVRIFSVKSTSKPLQTFEAVCRPYRTAYHSKKKLQQCRVILFRPRPTVFYSPAPSKLIKSITHSRIHAVALFFAQSPT